MLSRPPPTGLVVTLVLGDEAQDFLCRFFPSQLQHLILPQQNWDVLLVLGKMPSKDVSPTNHKNHTKNHYRRENQLVQKRKHALITCLNLQLHTSDVNNYSSSQQTWHNLDGSTMITEEYRVGLSLSSNTTTMKPDHDTPKETIVDHVRIFMTESQLQFPQYLQNDL